MAGTGHKIKVYGRAIGIGLVVLVVLVFMASNRERVTVKFLTWEIWHAPLFAFIFVVANGGILIYLVARKFRKVLGDLRDLRREDKTHKQLVDQIDKNGQTKTEPE